MVVTNGIHLDPKLLVFVIRLKVRKKFSTDCPKDTPVIDRQTRLSQIKIFIISFTKHLSFTFKDERFIMNGKQRREYTVYEEIHKAYIKEIRNGFRMSYLQ